MKVVNGLASQDVERGRMSEASLDQELVERVQRGDKKAFDLLVLKYQHKIVKLISRYIPTASLKLPIRLNLPVSLFTL